jgi:hypothetical protein
VLINLSNQINLSPILKYSSFLENLKIDIGLLIIQKR